MAANLTVTILSMISLIYTVVYSCKNIKLNIEKRLNRINTIMMLLTIFMLLLDMCNFLLPITSNNLFIITNCCLKLITFSLLPIFPLLGILFLKSILHLKPNIKNLFLINIINIIICILNLKFKFLYTIDENNIYSRSQYFFIPILFSLIYIFYFFILLFRYKQNIFKSHFLYFLFFTFIFIISALIQLIFKSIYIFWPICAALLIINYISIHEKALYYNTITLCKNKFALTKSLNYLFIKNHMFFLVFIKIENLNYISENLGSKEEKKAIINTCKLSKAFFFNNGELFHYKDDCFIALIERTPKTSINRIMYNLNSFFLNSNSNISCPLKYSFNYDLFDNSYSNVLDYLHYINKLIYN